MKFKSRNLRAIANMVIGDSDHFPYRSSFYITQFFEECDLEFVHDGSTRAIWTSERLLELLEDPQPAAFHLPARFLIVLVRANFIQIPKKCCSVQHGLAC
jgi:hypothetical protein